jgi:hypothetical protein
MRITDTAATLIALSALAPRLLAQNYTTAWGATGQLGLGFAAPYGFGAAYSITVRAQSVLIRARGAGTGGLRGGITDAGVLLGYNVPLTTELARQQRLSFGAGIGTITSCDRTPCPSLATVLDVTYLESLPFAGPVGLSFYGFANLNSQHSFGGVAVGLYVGKL